jgi:hypothetical protein
MGLTVLTGQPALGSLVADRRLYENANGVPVEDGDPGAAYLLATPGEVLPPATVKRLGLRLDAESRVRWGAEAATAAPAAPAAETASLVALPGGWYQCRESDGTLRSENGEPMKVRGKAAALVHFGLREAGPSEEHDP